MNQILSVNIEKNKKNHKASIRSIVIVFCIILIIFGIGVTVTATYSYYKILVKNTSEDALINKASKEPYITTEREGVSSLNIVISHDKEITSIVYSINDGEEVEISGNNRTKVRELITLKPGINNIKITAKDIIGSIGTYETTAEVENKSSEEELTDGPKITLEQLEYQVKVVTESEVNIDEVKYYWDDDESNATVLKINDVKNETLIDVSLEGVHELHVEATDIEGKKSRIKPKKIMGVNKPEIKISTNGKVFRIVATDKEGLSKVEIKLNENETITENIEGTQFSKDITLENGVNKLTVTVYNTNGMSEVSRVKFTKE